MTKELTKGDPAKLILNFTIPLLFGLLFQQFYNLVDTVIVGRVLGTEGLASVGATGSLNFLVLGFCIGVCSGFSIPVAHKFGAGDYSGMRAVVANCTYLSVAFSLVLTVLTVIFCRGMLELMGTPADIIDGAEIYIKIIFWGIPTVFLYNVCAGIIRAVGDSRTPVVFLVISSFINIGLDLLFMLGLKTGVEGAAYATVISQAISGFLCLLFLITKYEILHIRKEEWKADLSMMGSLCSMGIPMGLQYSITAIGSVILQTGTNSLGSDAVAAVTAANRINNFLECPTDALGTCMATYAGQNVGAGELDRVTEGLKKSVLMGWIYSVFALGVNLIFGRSLARLFLDAGETEIIEEVRMCTLWAAATFVLLTLVNCVRFTIQGMGFPFFAIIAGIMEMIARSLCGIFIIPKFGFIGACVGSPLAWLLADCFLIPAYIHCIHKLKKNVVPAGR